MDTKLPFYFKQDAEDLQKRFSMAHEHENMDTLNGLIPEVVAGFAKASDVVAKKQPVEDEGKVLTVGADGMIVNTPATGGGGQGPPGLTPHIGGNGNWYIGETDTGVKAQGEDGERGRGIFTLKIEDGILYFVADEGVENPFEYDEETGMLYYKLDGGHEVIGNIKGEPGRTATISVGTVTMVGPDEPLEITNSGTATDAVLDFKIPGGGGGGVNTQATLGAAFLSAAFLG